MLPIVMYTGYAVLDRNWVSCVLSDKRIMGITVVPGLRSSRDC